MVASTAFATRSGWSVCPGIPWSVCPGIGGQLAPESGGLVHQNLHSYHQSKIVFRKNIPKKSMTEY
jgi:hypothetical protein